MDATEMRQTEVRKYPRIAPPKDVYAVFGMEKNVIGKLCDISMGGVCCKHFTDSENGHDYSSMDLFTLDNEFYMSRIPCSVVYSVTLDEDSEMKTTSAVRSRKVGVKFGSLNYLHQNQLKTFVDTVVKRWN
ncbi:MAG: PilZ domain-containing protein [Desulfamplus sp.]|nr:PilZ domain-containing protein [Desulfamplus sp.]